MVDDPVCHSDTARSNRHGRAVASTAAVVRDVVLTTQPQNTHHPGVIPQSEDVLVAGITAGRTDPVSDRLDTRMDSELDAREYEDPTQILSLLAEYVEKFDTGASRCMSGDPRRTLHSKRPLQTAVRITGFNSTRSTPTSMGMNADGKDEYYVEDMPKHLTLLCAHAYCTDGCAVLYEDGGLVLRMTKAELAALKEFLSSYPVVKHLVVNNRTYEVDNTQLATPEAMTVIEVDGERARSPVQEDALSGIATRFFNTKVNVSNQEERILTLLMTGLTFRDLYMHVKNKSLSGLPPDLTAAGPNRFAHKFVGRLTS